MIAFTTHDAVRQTRRVSSIFYFSCPLSSMLDGGSANTRNSNVMPQPSSDGIPSHDVHDITHVIAV